MSSIDLPDSPAAQLSQSIPLRYLSVCSGIEAASVAWHSLGWQPRAFAEIDKFPNAILQHHYPDVPNAADFTTIQGDQYGPIDLLVGGTPCQSFSVAGKRGGITEARGNLALEFCRLADRSRPEWVLWENVPGVFSSDKGEAFRCFLAQITGVVDLAIPPKGWKNFGIVVGMDGGYSVAWRVLDAQYFGVPQRRRRVFVVGHLGDWRRAAAVLLEPESLRGNPAPRREKGEGFTHDVAPSLTSSGRGVERGGDSRGQDPVVAVAWPQPQDLNRTIAHSVTCHQVKMGYPTTDNYVIEVEPVVTHSLRADGFDASEDGTGRGTPLVAFSCKDYGADVGETAPTLRGMGHNGSHANAGGQVAVAISANQRGEIRERPVHGALATSRSGKQFDGVITPQMAVRRLTPRECERLQGFPDDYTLVEYRGKPAADGPRYKALGNSMAVPVMRWIGERIARFSARNRP